MFVSEKERRQYPRQAFMGRANMIIGGSLQGREQHTSAGWLTQEWQEVDELEDQVLESHVADISWDGMCLTDINQFSGMHWIIADHIRQMPTKIFLFDANLTIWGNIIRINPRIRQAGVHISSTSNDDLWQFLCGAKY